MATLELGIEDPGKPGLPCAADPVGSVPSVSCSDSLCRGDRDEGEGDLSLDYWRRVHWDYFTKEAAANALDWMLATAADGYTWVERFAGELGRGVAGGLGAVAGKVIPAMVFAGLPSPGVVEGDIGGTLQAELPIPLGLAMADEGESHPSSLPCTAGGFRHRGSW